MCKNMEFQTNIKYIMDLCPPEFYNYFEIIFDNSGECPCLELMRWEALSGGCLGEYNKVLGALRKRFDGGDEFLSYLKKTHLFGAVYQFLERLLLYQKGYRREFWTFRQQASVGHKRKRDEEEVSAKIQKVGVEMKQQVEDSSYGEQCTRIRKLCGMFIVGDKAKCLIMLFNVFNSIDNMRVFYVEVGGLRNITHTYRVERGFGDNECRIMWNGGQSNIIKKEKFQDRNVALAKHFEGLFNDVDDIFSFSVKVYVKETLELTCRDRFVERMKRIKENHYNDIVQKGFYYKASFFFYGVCKYGHIDLLEKVEKACMNINVFRSCINKTCFGEYPLYWASLHNQIRVVKFMCKKGFRKGAHRSLAEACRYGNKQVVGELLVGGTDLTFQVNNFSFIFLLCRYRHLDILTHMLTDRRLNVDVNLRSGKNDPKATALQLACKKGFVEILECLLKYGKNINVNIPFINKVPLQRACESGNVRVVECFMLSDVDLNINGLYQGKTLLHIVTEKGNVEVLECILKNGEKHDLDVNVKDANQRTAFYTACSGGWDGIVRCFLKYADVYELYVNIRCNKKTPLYGACCNENVGVIRCLVQEGSGVLIDMLCNNASALHVACHKGYKEIVKILLEHGASLQAYWQGGQQKTPQKIAEESGHKDIVKMLNEHVSSMK